MASDGSLFCLSPRRGKKKSLDLENFGGSNLKGLFSVTLNFLKKLPSWIGGSAVTTGIGSLLLQLEGWETAGGLDNLRAQNSHLSADYLDEVIRDYHGALSILRGAIGSENGILESVQQAWDTLKKYPILLNSFEIPVPGSQESVLSPVEELREIELELEDIHPEEDTDPSWKRETNKRVEEFIETVSFFGTYKVIWDGLCGTRDTREELNKKIKLQVLSPKHSDKRDKEIDRLRRKAGYYDEVDDDTFSRIMEKIASIPNEDKKAAFISELHAEIGRREDLHFWTKWSAYLLTRIFHRITHFFAKRLTKGMVKFLREQINQFQHQPLKPINTEPLDRLADFFSSVQSGMERWAYDEDASRHRGKYLQHMVQSKSFNHQYDAKELRSECAKLAIDTFMPDLRWSRVVNPLMKKLVAWGKTNPFEPNQASKIVANKTLRICKKTLGGTAYMGLYLVKTVLRVSQYASGKFLGFATKRFLLRYDLIGAVIDNSRHSLYEQTAYTHALNVAVRDQLREVWKVLAKNERDETIIDEEPEATEEKIKLLIENVFAVLDMRECRTRKSMKDYFEKDPSVFNNLLQMPKDLAVGQAIENVVKMIVVAYQSVLQKNKMEKQLAGTFGLLSEAIVTADVRCSERKKQKLKKEYQGVENEIKQLLDIILQTAIGQAVDKKADDLTKGTIPQAIEFIDWIKVSLLGKDRKKGNIQKWRDAMEKYSRKRHKRNASMTDLKKLRNSFREFMNEWNSRQRALENTRELGDTSKNALKKRSQSLSRVAKKFQSHFKGLYLSQAKVVFSKTAKSPIHTMIAEFEEIEAIFEDSLDLERAQLHLECIQTLRAQLEKEVRIRTKEFSNLLRIIKEGELSIAKRLKALENYPDTMLVLRAISPREKHKPSLLTQLIEAKKRRFQSRWSRKYKVVYNQLKAKIKELPGSQNQVLLLTNLKKIDQAKDAETLKTESDAFVMTVKTIRRASRSSSKKSQRIAGKVAKKLRGKGDVALDGWKNAIRESNTKHPELITNCLEALDEMQEVTEQMEHVATIPIKLFDPKKFGAPIKSMIHKEMKRRSEGMLKMARDPNMYAGAINHVLFLNFLENMRPDKIRSPKEKHRSKKRRHV